MYPSGQEGGTFVVMQDSPDIYIVLKAFLCAHNYIYTLCRRGSLLRASDGKELMNFLVA